MSLAEYCEGGHDPAIKFHNRFGAKLARIIPDAYPGDAYSGGAVASMLYPNDLKFKEYQGGSDTTVVFENAKTGKGFQIFVKPYEHEQISLDQLKMDLSSGIVKDPVDISVDGVGATMFYSQNSAIGDTREVWFVKNGFLYEVTTYKELDAWLSSIMQTWKFLEF